MFLGFWTRNDFSSWILWDKWGLIKCLCWKFSQAFFKTANWFESFWCQMYLKINLHITFPRKRCPIKIFRNFEIYWCVKTWKRRPISPGFKRFPSSPFWDVVDKNWFKFLFLFPLILKAFYRTRPEFHSIDVTLLLISHCKISHLTLIVGIHWTVWVTRVTDFALPQLAPCAKLSVARVALASVASEGVSACVLTGTWDTFVYVCKKKSALKDCSPSLIELNPLRIRFLRYNATF